MPRSEMKTLFVGKPTTIRVGDKDNLVLGDGLKDEVTGAFLNSETVTFEVTTLADVAVGTGTGTMTYVAGTNGHYTGDTNIAIGITAGTSYYINILVAGKGAPFKQYMAKAKKDNA